MFRSVILPVASHLQLNPSLLSWTCCPLPWPQLSPGKLKLCVPGLHCWHHQPLSCTGLRPGTHLESPLPFRRLSILSSERVLMGFSCFSRFPRSLSSRSGPWSPPVWVPTLACMGALPQPDPSSSSPCVAVWAVCASQTSFPLHDLRAPLSPWAESPPGFGKTWPSVIWSLPTTPA